MINIEGLRPTSAFYAAENDTAEVTTESKTARFAKEHPVFKDEACHFPLLKGLGLLLLIGALSATLVLTAPFSLHFIPLAIAGVIIAIPILNINFKGLVYETSLIFTRLSAGQQGWMHVVHETESAHGKGKLYLGGIPLHNYDHVEDFKSKNITEVVSLIEPFEQQSITFGGTPVSHADWEEAGIEQTLIPTSDFNPVPAEKLQQAVALIHDTLARGENVYVHCKAGRGRSATAVICYLLQYQREEIGLTKGAAVDSHAVAHAIAYVKTTRERINLNSRQQQAVLDYFEFLKKSS
ncbi:dual specificity protein phosphatase family protein [Estrella lausannensis]|uniref:Protein tyrosine phosphatase n=1 Tax=Estrella lausannensis TaxID=483423 RepID=A0A0H5DQQ8_9BACT|nr:dual specificity protein phosphatase family protein [Estrella lausannensis]CRX38882.1 Protein tyrosine phosphatase [Estrella lausannensis]